MPYIALYTHPPTASGGGVEVREKEYSRQKITFTPARGGSCRNDIGVLFPVPHSTWGTIVSFGIMDAPSNGNLLFFGPINKPVVVCVGCPPLFSIGSIELTLGAIGDFAVTSILTHKKSYWERLADSLGDSREEV